MTAFAFACAALLAAILVWTTLPLWRTQPAAPVEPEAPASKGKDKSKGKAQQAASKEAAPAPLVSTERRWSTVLVALAVPALALAMYNSLSNWDWGSGSARSGEQMNVEEMLAKLEKKLKAEPDNVQGWTMLGRSYVQLGRFALGVDAYQHAYDLTKGADLDAITGLAEALVLMEETSLAGRAGQLFDEALTKDPRNTKALWYGGMAALQTGQLRVSRDRFALLLEAEDLPENIRTMLQSQVTQLNGQLGEAGNVVSPVAAAGSGPTAPSAAPASPPAAPQAEPAAAGKRAIKVAIKLAPNLKQQVTSPLRLFVLARDPAGGGPPLAVQRHSSEQLPMTVTLTEADAMMPARTIASAQRVTIVARLSLTGAPQAQSGDFFGEATYEFGKNTDTVQITIDQRVP